MNSKMIDENTEKICEWVSNEWWDNTRIWWSECGTEYYTSTDPLDEQGYIYCPDCGRRILQGYTGGRNAPRKDT